MTKPEYQKYLRSPHWKDLRRLIFARIKRRCGKMCCELCGAEGEPLAVHHKTYRNLGAEFLEDLELLCHQCHQQKHHPPVTFEELEIKINQLII